MTFFFPFIFLSSLANVRYDAFYDSRRDQLLDRQLLTRLRWKSCVDLTPWADGHRYGILWSWRTDGRRLGFASLPDLYFAHILSISVAMSMR